LCVIVLLIYAFYFSWPNIKNTGFNKNQVLFVHGHAVRAQRLLSKVNAPECSVGLLCICMPLVFQLVIAFFDLSLDYRDLGCSLRVPVIIVFGAGATFLFPVRTMGTSVHGNTTASTSNGFVNVLGQT
jgi:hypothetical protein